MSTSCRRFSVPVRVFALFSVPVCAVASAASNDTVVVVESARLSLPVPIYAATTAEGLVAGVPGVTASGQGYLSPQTDLRVRGGAFNASGLAVGGLALRNPQTEHFNADMPLPSLLFQTPRLLTGADQFATTSGHPAGSLSLDFGAASEGGRFVVGGGPYGHLFAFGTAAVQQEAGDGSILHLAPFFARDTVDRTDGQPDNGLERWQAGAHAQVRTSLWQTDVVAAAARRHFGARGFYGAPATFASTETVQDALAIASTSGECAPDTPLRLTALWRRTTDDYWLDEPRPSLYANHHVTDLLAGHGDVHTRLAPSLELDARLDGALERIDSRYQGTLPGQGLGDHQRARGSLALLPAWVAGRLRAQAGGAVEVFSDDDAAWLPAASLSCRTGDADALFVSYTEAVRQPSYTELNYESPGSLGQAGLARQRTRTLEGGWRGDAGPVSLRAVLFYEAGSEVVDWIRTAPGERWTATNLRSVHTRGIEAAGAWRAGDALTLTLDARAVDKACDRDVYASRYVLDYARVEARAGIEARLTRQASVRVCQEVGHQAHNPARAGTRWRALTGVEGRYALSRLGLALLAGVDNLFDSGFEVFPGQPPAGRRWHLAAEWAW